MNFTFGPENVEQKNPSNNPWVVQRGGRMDRWIPMWQWHNVGPASSPASHRAWIHLCPRLERGNTRKSHFWFIIHINWPQFKACHERGGGEGSELSTNLTSESTAQPGRCICSYPSAWAEIQAIKRIMRSFNPFKKVIPTHYAKMGELNCPTTLWVKRAPVSFVLVTEKKKKFGDGHTAQQSQQEFSREMSWLYWNGWKSCHQIFWDFSPGLLDTFCTLLLLSLHDIVKLQEALDCIIAWASHEKSLGNAFFGLLE